MLLLLSTEDRDGDGVKNLALWLVGADQQRNQSEPGRERGHQHWRKPLKAPPIDQIPTERFAFEECEVDIMADLEDTVPGGDAGKRDEADRARDRQRLSRNPQHRKAADQSERDVHQGDDAQNR